MDGAVAVVADHTRVVQQSVKYFQALAARTWMVTVSCKSSLAMETLNLYVYMYLILMAVAVTQCW